MLEWVSVNSQGKFNEAINAADLESSQQPTLQYQTDLQLTITKADVTYTANNTLRHPLGASALPSVFAN